MSAPSTGNDYRECEPLWSKRGTESTCSVHGGRFYFLPYTCQTVRVLKDVRAERARQFARYGTNEDLDFGTGPETRWLQPISYRSASLIAEQLRGAYEEYEEETGKPTWVHLVLEEMAETFMEADPEKLRAELIQVAALAVSWVEKIDAGRES